MEMNARYLRLKHFFHSAYLRPFLRASGVVMATYVILSRAAMWMDFANQRSPFLGIIMLIGLMSLLFRTWTVFSGDVKTTGFQLSRFLLSIIRIVCIEYLWYDPRKKEMNLRRKESRRMIRMFLFFVMSAHCLSSWNSFSLNCLYAMETIFFYKFGSKSVSHLFHARFLPFSSIILCVFTVPVFLSRLIYSFYTQPMHTALTTSYFLISQSYTRQALTKFLTRLDFDMFEGLEEYYVIGALSACEITATVILIVTTLISHLQSVALISLFTSVYNGGREVLTDTVRAAFKEWSLLAHFDKASHDDLISLDDVCAICLAPMKNARKTACQHILHGRCLRRWLREKQTCPICITRIL